MAVVPSRVRDERKLQTRQAMLHAALTLVENEHSFSSLSLREVTREAGIVPTAFYRHFRDMEELGLALVDECFRSLHQSMRAARAGALPTEHLIAASVKILVDYVRSNRLHILFIARERFGGMSMLRNAIRNELRLFASELAMDLGRFPVLNQWRAEDLQILSGLIVNTMVAAAEQMLEAQAQREEEMPEIVRRTEKQVRLIMLGVPLWKPKPRA
jgi:AcrR family transcriptional regulator